MKLPTIDIAELASSDFEMRANVGSALKEACLEHGFFYCNGHRIPHGLINAVLDETRSLFALPEASKRTLDKKHSPANRGYEVLGGQTLQPGAAPDRKEGFYIGEDLTPDHPRVKAGAFNAGANQWPPDLPAFRPVMVAYFAALNAVASTIMRGLVPFIYNGNPDHEVRCIPNCLSAGEVPRYEPIRVQDHLRAMYARTYVNNG